MPSEEAAKLPVMKIHREGYSILLITAVLLAVVNGCIVYFSSSQYLVLSALIFSFILFIFFLQFFRYPHRIISRDETRVLAPADGKIVVIEQTDEPEFLKDKRMMISIFMSPLNVHANWYPISGRIKYLRYHAGKYLVAWHPKSSTQNERSTIVIEKENRLMILVRQVAGLLARRIVYYPHENDMVKQGAEMGFIKFGSRLDVYLPLDAKVMVELDQKTKGGVTVLAELK